jgi:hypothetical protein
MEHDTSLGTELRLRQGRGGSNAPDEPELRHGRPAPSTRREGPDASRPRGTSVVRPESDVSSFAASLPLFLFGAVCTGFGVFVRFENSHAVIARIPLWLPLVAIGLIALVGGTLSVFATSAEATEETIPASTRRPYLPPARRPVPAARFDGPTAEWTPSRDVTAYRSRPRTLPEPASPAVARTTPPPRSYAASSLPESEVTTPESTADSLVSWLDEIDSIQVDLHEPAGPSPSMPTNAMTPSEVDADAAAIDAELANLLGETQAAAQRVRPRPERPTSGTRPALARCVECGSKIIGPGEVSRCRGCDEPLCVECRARSVAEGKPDLCVFCSVLDEFPPETATPPAPTSGRA